MHDTLTVKQWLMENLQWFYELAETIVGSNFLVAQHEVEWDEETAMFKC